MKTLARQELQQSIENAIRNPEDFCIRLSEVWEDVGYSRYDATVRAMKSRLKEAEDYTQHAPHSCGASFKNYSLLQDYLLSGDGFKDLCLSASTEKGREMRKYYIQVEKEYRKLLTASLNRSLVTPVEDPRIGQMQDTIGNLCSQLAEFSQAASKAKEEHGELYVRLMEHMNSKAILEKQLENAKEALEKNLKEAKEAKAKEAKASETIASLSSQLGSASQAASQDKGTIAALQADRISQRSVVGSAYVERPDDKMMKYDLMQVRTILGYTTDVYTWKVVKECLERDEDYFWDGKRKEILLTEAALQELAIVARSCDGCQADRLPELLVVERSRLFRKGTGKANTRHAQSN